MSCLNVQCEIRRRKGMLEIRESETQFIPVILMSEIGNLFARVRRFKIEVSWSSGSSGNGAVGKWKWFSCLFNDPLSVGCIWRIIARCDHSWHNCSLNQLTRKRWSARKIKVTWSVNVWWDDDMLFDFFGHEAHMVIQFWEWHVYFLYFPVLPRCCWSFCLFLAWCSF